MKAIYRIANVKTIQNLLDKGLTQSQVARVLNVSRQNIHQLVKSYNLKTHLLDKKDKDML